MELFNAIFETFWTFAGSVVLLAIVTINISACFVGLGRLSVVKIIKHYKKAGK